MIQCSPPAAAHLGPAGPAQAGRPAGPLLRPEAGAGRKTSDGLAHHLPSELAAHLLHVHAQRQRILIVQQGHMLRFFEQRAVKFRLAETDKGLEGLDDAGLLDEPGWVRLQEQLRH